MKGSIVNRESSPTVRVALGRAIAWAFRIRELALAEWAFRRGGFCTRRFFGYDLCLDSSRSTIHKLLCLLGERCIEERAIIRSLVKPGMRVLDVGANVGYYALMLAHMVGEHGQVICVEPSPENLPELRLNVERNSLANVSVIPMAVGAENGEARLLGGINSGVVADGGAYSIQVKKIDDLGVGKIDLLKMDIEGHEGFALDGASRTLAENRPVLFIECHPKLLRRAGDRVGRVVGILRASYGEDLMFWDGSSCACVGPVQRVLARYFGASVRQVKDPDALVRASDAGDRDDSFWIVAGAGRSGSEANQ